MKTELNENGTCTAARHRTRPLPSARIAPRPANREYLRALRAAELAAWQEPRPRPRPARATPAAPVVIPPRLPSPTRDAAEGRLFAVLSALALASVLHGLLTSGEFVLRWERFVALVTQWLG